jgi:CheY-like chemotaxis protein
MLSDAKTVLIATNDPHIAYLLQRYARRSGLQPVQTGAADKVPGLARTTQPALIILELDSMPGSREALRRLRSNSRTRAIPVVVYTASGDESLAPALRVAGQLSAAVLYDDFVATLHQVGVQP